MSNHIPNSKLKEKKLNINKQKTVNIDNVDLNELTKEQRRKREQALLVYNDIMDVFKKHNTSVNDTYYILASILESIYAYSILDDLGIKNLK